MTQLIACEMLRDELELAMDLTGIHPPVLWMEKGLHDVPQKLHQELQAVIDALPEDCQLVLLAMALCGGAMDGIVSRHASLAVPRFDDCIRMLLSTQPGLHNGADARSLYFTRQWLTSPRYIVRDYEMYIQRYGEKKARRAMAAMLANYQGYALIDTGAYDLLPYEDQAKADAETLGLTYRVVPGGVRVLQDLLKQDFGQEICLVPPGTPLTQRMFLRMSE